MNRIQLSVSLAALTLLTGACGVVDLGGSSDGDDPVPSVSPGGGPALKQAWQTRPDTVGPSGTSVAGNIVVSTSKDTDDQGHPLVALDDDVASLGRETVYDANGHLVWKATTQSGLYAGGYSAEQQQSKRNPLTSALVIRKVSGGTVAGLPMPSYIGDGTTVPDIGFQQVRPGLLVVSGFGAYRSRVALLDVSRPGKARAHLLRAPADVDPRGVQVAVSDGHLYVRWGVPSGRPSPIARYDAPGTNPVWHGQAPPAAGNETDIHAYPGGTVTVTDGLVANAKPHVWFLNPETGAAVGPQAGLAGKLIGVSGGRAYLQDRQDPLATQVLDARTGAKKQTIAADIDGVTTGGLLIDEHNSYQLTAFRWG